MEPYLSPGQANISYAVFPAWRGRGLATRAVRLLVEWLRERGDVREAVIRADPGNPASSAVARAAGFTYRGHTADEHGDLDWFVRDLRTREPRVSVVFVCAADDGRILLARRGAGARDEPGTWDCGAGALEFGESFEAAVEREVTEEYATAPREMRLCGVRNVIRADQHWVAVVFRVRVDPAAVAIGEPHKFDELGWFRPGELPSPLHSQLPATLEAIGG
jgi:ADP-ribose pyrophosphatase YjhB (NUDIX family)